MTSPSPSQFTILADLITGLHKGSYAHRELQRGTGPCITARMVTVGRIILETATVLRNVLYHRPLLWYSVPCPAGSGMFLESFSLGQGGPLLLARKVGVPRVASFIPTYTCKFCHLYSWITTCREGRLGGLDRGIRDVTYMYNQRPIQLSVIFYRGQTHDERHALPMNRILILS